MENNGEIPIMLPVANIKCGVVLGAKKKNEYIAKY